MQRNKDEKLGFFNSFLIIFTSAYIGVSAERAWGWNKFVVAFAVAGILWCVAWFLIGFFRRVAEIVEENYDD